jgi:hypothetical protein
MTTLRKALWAAAVILLLLCLRFNSERTIDGRLDCADPKSPEWTSPGGCSEQRSWTVSLKLPWMRW